MLLQSSGGWSCLIQDEYAHTSGNWRRTVGRLEVSLSPRVAFSVWPAWASLHVGEDSCSSAYQFSACIMLATPSLDKANVGRACTRV